MTELPACMPHLQIMACQHWDSLCFAQVVCHPNVVSSTQYLHECPNALLEKYLEVLKEKKRKVGRARSD